MRKGTRISILTLFWKQLQIFIITSFSIFYSWDNLVPFLTASNMLKTYFLGLFLAKRGLISKTFQPLSLHVYWLICYVFSDIYIKHTNNLLIKNILVQGTASRWNIKIDLFDDHYTTVYVRE